VPLDRGGLAGTTTLPSLHGLIDQTMAAKSKAQLLNQVLSLLKKRYKLEPSAARQSVLEATIYAICHEDATREQANQAISRFKDDFFDWNEVRVSSLEQIQGVLAGLSNPEERAYKIRRFLRQLFEKTFGFALDGLVKKPLKESAKILQEYEAFASDFVLATVIQQALGGHAIPIDAAMRRGLERLGAAEPDVESATLRATLERAIPKNRGVEFVDLMEELTHDTCITGAPDCARCELRKICPTGQARKNEWTARKAPASAHGKDGAKKTIKKAKTSPGKPHKPRPK
jgi:endonuclease III